MLLYFRTPLSTLLLFIIFPLGLYRVILDCSIYLLRSGSSPAPVSMISTTTTLTSQLQVHTSRQVPRLTRSISHVCVTSPRGLVLAVHSGRIATQRRRQDQTLPKHFFSTTSTNQLRDFFPSKDTPHIQRTKPAWPHHGYTMEEMLAVEPVHRKPRNMSDWAAWKIVRFARFWMDKMTGMGRAQQVDKKHPTTAVVAEKPLTEAQWVRP